MLILGEAIIEGIGAALMTPATLAILSTTFVGTRAREGVRRVGRGSRGGGRVRPVLGGFLTTNYSWRWAFRHQRDRRADRGDRRAGPDARGQRKARRPIDLPGAALIAAGMFLLVFALSEGGTLRLVRAAEFVQRRRARGLAGVGVRSRSCPWPSSLVDRVLLASASSNSSEARHGATPTRCSTSPCSSCVRSATGS